MLKYIYLIVAVISFSYAVANANPLLASCTQDKKCFKPCIDYWSGIGAGINFHDHCQEECACTLKPF
jgi:hypothetical protein